jgi:hypothetical protein
MLINNKELLSKLNFNYGINISMDRGTFRSGLSEPEVVEVGFKKRANTVYDEVTAALDDSNKHEKDMKEMMLKSVQSARSNYQFKARANGILVIIGVILIANPIVFIWLRSTGMIPAMTGNSDLTNLNYFLGGIGIVAFVTTFFNRPQENMSIALGDLVQLHLICNMYTLQFHGIVGKLKEQSKNALDAKEICDERDIDRMNERLYHITNNAIELIDNHIEKYSRGSTQFDNTVYEDNKGNFAVKKEATMKEKMPINENKT